MELFQQLTLLIGKEEKVKDNVRKSEEEVKSILNDRTHEETVTELTVSIYDTERNVKARQYKIDLVSCINRVDILFRNSCNSLINVLVGLFRKRR